ncbi:thioesterase II family protein [Streptomyces sp. XD-27]|uniref:thioesterase II family protein n=1 Tax=Streptomyces sp. XD-27 TaxID=3062779 RepID=UPI0026F47A6F|nr:alpha/beta fold hydrolase [Streptomyces sp. XD-27]WKX73985.1 alpha/beta fold hydrolase [Streptomyces sp. XD-27]
MSTDLRQRPAPATLVTWAPGTADGPALICLPWAGASAVVFRTWASAFPEDVGVYGVRLPGRENRMAEPALTDVAEVIEEVRRAIDTLPHERIALFGHCSGALVAFELARELGPAVVQLSVASQLPPAQAARAADEELVSREQLARRYLDRELLDEPDIVQLLLPVLEADMQAISMYRYREGPLQDVPLAVFRGTADEEIGLDDIIGWHAQTTGHAQIRELAGADHLFSGPAWTGLAACVAEELGAALRR